MWLVFLLLVAESAVNGQECTRGHVRLVDDNGSDSRNTTGFVQVCDQNQWKIVYYYCGWDKNKYAPNLACRQLGYMEHGAVSRRAHRANADSGISVRCMGDERLVSDCSLMTATSCNYWHATLTCRKANCSNGEVRLVSGSTHREGRVEVCVDGRWGTVCGEGWGDSQTGLVCRRLGFPREGAMIHQFSGVLIQPIYSCPSPDGNCTHAPDSCNHTMDMGVRCSTHQEAVESSSKASKALGAITGILMIVLIAVVTGWILTCVLVKKKRSNGPCSSNDHTAIPMHTNQHQLQLDNPVYNESSTPRPQTNYSSHGPTYEQVTQSEGHSYDVVSTRGGPTRTTQATPSGAHGPSRDPLYNEIDNATVPLATPQDYEVPQPTAS